MFEKSKEKWAHASTRYLRLVNAALIASIIMLIGSSAYDIWIWCIGMDGPLQPLLLDIALTIVTIAAALYWVLAFRKIIAKKKQ
jgi:hypothetical protein